MASASSDRTVRLWVPTYTGGYCEFMAHSSAVRSVHFSPDGNNIVTSSDDKSVKLWNTDGKRRFISSMTHHTNWVRCARFSPNGLLIGSCSDDNSAIIWDYRSYSTFFTSLFTNHFTIFIGMKIRQWSWSRAWTLHPTTWPSVLCTSQHLRWLSPLDTFGCLTSECLSSFCRATGLMTKQHTKCASIHLDTTFCPFTMMVKSRFAYFVEYS